MNSKEPWRKGLSQTSGASGGLPGVRRYEYTIRNLHELQRLQAMRAGERVTPPAVVDVDINVRQNGIGQDGAANPESILQNKPPFAEPVSAMIEDDATPIDDKENQISSFITASQKAELRRRGFSDDDIANMKPEKARETLALAFGY